MAWGAAGLSSSLGTSPTTTTPSSGGGWGSSGLPVGTLPSSGGGGNWWGSLTNPLGLRTGITQLATGLVKGITEPLVNTGYGVYHAGASLADLATGNETAAQNQATAGKTSLRQAYQGAGDFGTSLATSVEQLTKTAALPFGGEARYGASQLLGRDVFQPFNKWLADKGSGGNPANWNASLSPEMAQELYNNGKGMMPQDWFEASSKQGVGAGTLQTAMNAAMLAAPVAGVSAAIAGDASDAAAAAEEAGATADAAHYTEKAARWQGINDIASKFEHPYKTVGGATADALAAMRAQAFPADVPAAQPEAAVSPFNPGAAPEDQAVADTATVPQELVGAARDTLHPTQAAAEAMSASTDLGYQTSPDLQNALQAAIASTAGAADEQAAAANAPIPPGMVRLYNGGTQGDQTMWTDDIKRAQSYARMGEPIRHIDVDANQAAELQVRADGGTPNEAYTKAMQAGHQPVPNKDYYLGDNLDLTQSPVEHPVTPPEGEQASTPAPKVEPQLEPRSYDVSKGRPVDPEEKSVLQEQLRSETAAARESVNPPLYVVDQLGQRLNMPTPEWANQIAENLPDSVNKLLGKVGANFVDQVRYRNMYRNLQQALETSQNAARSSPAMRAAEDAARTILSSAVDRGTASALIGEEIHARLNGEALVGEWTKAHDGFTPSDVQAASLRDAARGGYRGIDDATLAKLTPDARAQLQESINKAVMAFRDEAAKTLQTLLATKYGAKGLEAALLGPDEVPMTAEQIRLYRRSERDLRFAAKARERIPGEMEKLQANADQAEATGARLHGFADQLRARLGMTLQTVTDLYRGVPKGLENDAAATVQLGLRTVAQEGGALLDIGTGEALHPTDGVYVPIATQFDVPLEQWATDGAAALHDAMLNPKAQNGMVYDPQALWGGPDAKLAVNVATAADGSAHVTGNISMHTVNGDPMSAWQAYVIGSAHQAGSGLDFATGNELPMSLDPNEQTLMMHYEGMARDSSSPLARWAEQRAKVIADPNLNISTDQLNTEMTANLWLDHVMEGRNPSWSKGDIFKTDLAAAKGEPTLSYLAQTILGDHTTNDHVDAAMNGLDAEGVNSALRWYYDSHDFIEQQWRGKTVPLTGRDAADTMYDLIALTSVMASPTQNLGRALAGMANLDDFLKSRNDALTSASDVMNQVMGNKPNDIVYVKNLGVTSEDLPRNLGETTAQYNRRLARDGERVVPKGQGGTAISRRWLDSPAARELSNQTSMTTAPKYRIIDALMGKFNLESATAEDIAGQPEWWTGKPSPLSDKSVSPQAIMHHADLLGITGPELDAYKQWAVDHERVQGAADVRAAAGKEYIAPITDAEDVQRQRAEGEADENGIRGGREVSAQEYQNMANDGRAYVEQRLANSSPNVLNDPTLRDAAYNNVQAEWGGATVDAHTGQAIPADYHGDTYAVTARLKGMKEITVPIGASKSTFDAAYARALRMYQPVLDGEGGHLGVFRNEDTGNIELDPVYHTQNVADTEAVGTYTHANGGAYHFASGNGHWTPHVRDDEAFTSNDAAKKAVSQSTAYGRALSRSDTMRPAYENALTEYHGSGALAKLRSFRDNLAHPDSSLAVTLDSIMAQVFGFDKTHWGVKGEYAKYADQIRETAANWSQVAGRPVMPHEVQALLWIYAKRFIGEQDWGRLQAHVANAHTVLDTLEAASKAGKGVVVKNFDPLGPWWNEELQFSRDQLAVRSERTPLRTARTAGTLTPEQASRLDYLENVPTRQASDVQVMTKDGTVEYQPRNETSYDAKVLSGKEMQRIDYLKQVVVPMREAIDNGDYNKARSILDEFVASRRKSILGVTEGTPFGPKMLEDPKSVAAQSLARLQYADHVPAPNPIGLNTEELYSKFGDRVRGVTLENPNSYGRIMMRLYSTADVSTLLHEDLHAFRLHAPGDEVAQLSETYPHIQDATMTDARRADEEKFVGDFMGYLRSRASDTTYTGPLGKLFTDIADTMEQHYGPALNTESGQAVPNSIVNYWDSIFNPDIQKPNKVDDPLAAQYVPKPKGINPTQLRGESDFQFAQRTRQYGEARGQATVLQQRINDADARARQADKFANKMAGLVLEPTRSDIVAQKLEDRATRTLGTISDQLQNASGNQVPRGWRPYMAAIDRIRAEAKDDPSLAPILDEIPDNFASALQHAASLGFEPTYMPELTWDMAQKYMYHHLTLGDTVDEAGMRKVNTGVLNRAGVVDRSMESLGAGSVMAMKELLQSRLVQFTEENYAREWTPGTPIPEGWRPWEPTRDAIVTGRRIEDAKTVAVNSNKIIPEAAYNALKGFQKPAVDLPFRFLWKGAPVAVWKNLLLTYSPTWYIKHFIGAVTLATLDGVRPTDWKTAWTQYKTDTLPDVVRGRAIYQAMDDELGTAGSLIQRNGIGDAADLVRSEGVKVAAREVNNKLRSVVKTVDSLGRAAVYAKTLRTGGSTAFAASRAYEALGDFGRLSPIERSMVTQLIPFYAFQKSMFRVLLRMPADHPLAAGLLMQLGEMHQEYLKSQLNGTLPSAYNGSDFINGHLTELDKLNPLTDAWKIATPDGLAASANPFIKLLAQEALHSPSYGAVGSMSSTGSLVPSPNLGQSIIDTYTGEVPGVGEGFGPGNLSPIPSGLSDAQYQQLVARILKAEKAEATVNAGGYLVTDAYAPKKATTGASGGGWGSG